MADADLLELERSYRSSGSLADGVAYFRALERAGVVETRDLELAAYCGQEPAQTLTEIQPPERQIEWAERLWQFGHVVSVQAALAAVSLRLSGPQPELLEQVLDLVRAWIAKPSKTREKAIAAVENGLLDLEGQGPFMLCQAITCAPDKTWEEIETQYKGYYPRDRITVCRHQIDAILYDAREGAAAAEVRRAVARALLPAPLRPGPGSPPKPPTPEPVPVVRPSVPTRVNARLEKGVGLSEILAAPADDALRLAWASALEAERDPRGEFIRLQVSEAEDAKAQKRARALLRLHKDEWLGEDLAQLLSNVRFERGTPISASLSSRASPFAWERALTNPSLGTIERLKRVRVTIEDYLAFVSSPAMVWLAELQVPRWSVLEGIAATSVTRQFRELDLTPLPKRKHLELIANSPAFAHVTSLTLTVKAKHLKALVRDLDATGLAPRLTTLSLPKADPFDSDSKALLATLPATLTRLTQADREFERGDDGSLAPPT